jgi:hypothetical protein
MPEAMEAREAAAKLLGVNPRYVSHLKRLKRDEPEAFDGIKSGETGDREARNRLQNLSRQRKREPIAALAHPGLPKECSIADSEEVRVEHSGETRKWRVFIGATCAYVEQEQNLKAVEDEEYTEAFKGMRYAAAELRAQAAELTKTAELIEAEASRWSGPSYWFGSRSLRRSTANATARPLRASRWTRDCTNAF